MMTSGLKDEHSLSNQAASYRRSLKYFVLFILVISAFKLRTSVLFQVNEEIRCQRPGTVANGQVLCNSGQMMEGTRWVLLSYCQHIVIMLLSRCLLECDHGWVPAHQDITVCQLVSVSSHSSISFSITSRVMRILSPPSLKVEHI